MKITFLLYIILLQISIIITHKCGHDLIKKKSHKISIDRINTNRRGLSTDFAPIKIKIDYTYLESQKKLKSKTLEELKKILSDVTSYLSALLSMKHEDIDTDEDEIEKYCEIPKVYSGIDTALHENDLIIFPMISSDLDEDTNAAAWSCMTLTNEKPLAGIVEINPNLSFDKKDSFYYMRYLLMHELSHVLGFSSSFFKEKKMTITERVNGVKKTYLNSEKVLEKARIHFNCENIKGVPLENQGGDGSAGSHWEARYMLGDYMISTDYPEMVISDITLAFFEDTGFYKVNYYTGGLFRYGKNQGCAFLENECVTNGGALTLFPNEFCTEREASFCGSSHVSRGDCYITTHKSIESQFRHYNNKKLGGFASADYCPVSYTYYDEDLENNYNFPWNCNFGEKLYGKYGEVIGEDSVCFDSSLVSTSSGRSLDDLYSICYKVECVSESRELNIYIGNSIVTCPERGTVLNNPSGFVGQIKCPNYNNICTSKTWCNEIFECIDKKSEADLSTYKYINSEIDIGCDYPINMNEYEDDEDVGNFISLNIYIFILETIILYLL